MSYLVGPFRPVHSGGLVGAESGSQQVPEPGLVNGSRSPRKAIEALSYILDRFDSLDTDKDGRIKRSDLPPILDATAIPRDGRLRPDGTVTRERLMYELARRKNLPSSELENKVVEQENRRIYGARYIDPLLR